eukprot:scaffold8389_cov267-Pinguiococcus_pyrenoidosus.AAC.2
MDARKGGKGILVKTSSANTRWTHSRRETVSLLAVFGPLRTRMTPSASGTSRIGNEDSRALAMVIDTLRPKRRREDRRRIEALDVPCTSGILR